MIKNIIKTPQFISVTLDDGTVLVTYTSTSEMLAKIKACKDNQAVIALISPEDDADYIAPSEAVLDAMSEEGDFESQYIEFRNNRAYLPEISDLTLPLEFVEKFIAAEKAGDEILIQTYLNFWTLVSMNPNSEVRNNLFWFINKWGIKLTKSGLLITYRNAVYKHEGKFTKQEVERITKDYLKVKSWKKSPKNYCYKDGALVEYGNKPDGTIFGKSLAELYTEATQEENTTVFTDQHSHSTTIKLGHPVSIPREDCDANQHHTCSQGLHQASAQWLENNYYGDTGLVCLVNPANIVAVPPEDSYGKMRCCEYLPIAIAEFGPDGHIKEDVITDGFEDEILVDYAGKVNNNDLDDYTIGYAGTVGIDRAAIADRIMRMANGC